MGNKIKVAVIKIRTVKPQCTYSTSDNDIYPYFFNATTTFKVYLSDDISNDMTVAHNAVKGITDNIETEVLKLTAEGPHVDTDDSKRLSKELTLQAVELLSSALPEYEFTAAENLSDLNYEIRDNGGIKPAAETVEGRQKVMKYILFAVIISAIIPYASLPGASHIVISIYTMFLACTLYCLLTWGVAHIINADKIAISIGILPRICLYMSKNTYIFCGPIPLPDIGLPETAAGKYYKSWTVGTIPPVILSLIGYLLMYYRNYLFETSPDAIAGIIQCPVYSIAALAALSCILTSAVALLLFLEKAKELYPHRAFTFTLMEFFIVGFGIMTIYKNADNLLKFIGI